jgi:hypothetical protein
MAAPDEMKILVNHVGYDRGSPKRAVIQACTDAGKPEGISDFCVIDARSGDTAFRGKARLVGPVARWKNRVFWSLDFTDLMESGSFVIQVPLSASSASDPPSLLRSAPFEVAEDLLLRRTAAAVLQYFRSQHCTGIWDAADHDVGFAGRRRERVDVHGGWYDASGDLSKYLSHLSFANYMNPQQTPMVVWNFLQARDLLDRKAAAAPKSQTRALHSLREELLQEALYGADFLVRMQDPAGYFYMTVFDGWSKDPKQRQICSYRSQAGHKCDDYQAGFRQGGGVAIAALARVGTLGSAGQFTPRQYLETALAGFDHLEEHNPEYLDDGRENIIDEYCALLAAAELYRACELSPADRFPGTGRADRFLKAARRRASALGDRLGTDERFRGWWRADDSGERPFYHAAEAGLPAISLLRYAEIEPDGHRRNQALAAVRSSLQFEMAVTAEVPNPFGYARQYVRSVGGEKRSAFFIPHRNETGYWWQGEDARLASLAAAARMAMARMAMARMAMARMTLPGSALPGSASTGTAADRWEASRPGADPPPAGGHWQEIDSASALERYARDQLNWILGLNPFDVCMLHGFGRNNPEYEPDYPNVFGGICNGVTAGFGDEEDIDFLPDPYAAQGEHRWRWSEQWIPHAAWYLLAVCAG